MNIKSLSMALRNKATELSRVLARLVEGKPIAKAFGAPGDWGYETPVGAALHEPADMPELGAPVDQDKLIEQYRITCEAQQKTIERLRGIVQRAEAGDSIQGEKK